MSALPSGALGDLNRERHMTLPTVEKPYLLSLGMGMPYLCSERSANLWQQTSNLAMSHEVL